MNNNHLYAISESVSRFFFLYFFGDFSSSYSCSRHMPNKNEKKKHFEISEFMCAELI